MPEVRCEFTRMASVDELKQNPRNPNTHPAGQIALLAKVLRHQGWRAPIIVSNQSGLIVVGHGRLEAAQMLGLDVVPVDDQDFVTPEDEWAHMLADNRIAELAEMDLAGLKDLIGELDTGAMDLDLTGFDEETLGKMMTATVAPGDFQVVDENIETAHECPKCGYRWSGGEPSTDEETE